MLASTNSIYTCILQGLYNLEFQCVTELLCQDVLKIRMYLKHMLTTLV